MEARFIVKLAWLPERRARTVALHRREPADRAGRLPSRPCADGPPGPRGATAPGTGAHGPSVQQTSMSGCCPPALTDRALYLNTSGTTDTQHRRHQPRAHRAWLAGNAAHAACTAPVTCVARMRRASSIVGPPQGSAVHN